MINKRSNKLPLVIGAFILFAAVIIWFNIALARTQAASDERHLASIKQSVENAVTMCYSIEGIYPEKLKHLTDSYGVNYDTDKYIVHYECIAANIRPTITVIERDT